MDILGQFDGPHAVRIFNLITKFGLALVGMSAAAIVGSVVQGIRYKQARPYTYVAFAAICYLIYGAIIGTILDVPIDFTSRFGKDNPLDLVQSLTSRIIASGFFLAISAPVVWILLFDIFRAVSSPNQKGIIVLGVKLVPSLAGTYFGYLWAIIHIVIAIAYSGSLRALMLQSFTYKYPSDATLVNISNCAQLLVYGLWVFFIPLLAQLFLSRRDLRHIHPTFGLYIIFTILVTIGFTVGAEKPAIITVARSLVIAHFVLTQVCGVLALYVAIIAGHTWTSTVLEEHHDEERQAKHIHEDTTSNQ